ncbi:MAG: replicative DNA helicase [Alphaproteobacteria bacterium]|nr:replicative DNA helicase [Alphaproteobacteria bacterium]
MMNAPTAPTQNFLTPVQQSPLPATQAVLNDPLPYNLEAEQALLGALLLNNAVLEHVSDFLRTEHFANPIHSRIYDAILRLVDKGHIADPITLKDFLIKDDFLEPVGGVKYLIDLANGVVSVISVADYGRLIHDLYLRRQLIQIGQEIVQDAKKHEIDQSATSHIEEAEKKLYDLATKGQATSGPISFREALTQAITTAEIAYKRDSRIVGVTTGFIDLDKWLGGLHPSDLLILAGRPSMGKTALATNLAFNAAKYYAEHGVDGANVAFFSLEMSAEQLATRILSSESGISSDKIRRGEIRADDFPKFVEVSRQINSIGLFIDDTPALTITSLRNRARRLKRQHNIGLIVIDYLQLLEAGGNRRGGDSNRVQEISEITRALKGLAKELSVPVLALSQLSRAVEQRDDKRPQLSDLRESGSIEQDADVVMFVFREEYYESRKEPPEGTEKYQEWQKRMSSIYNQAEVIISKQRHGPVGTIKLFFDGKLTRFGNLSDSGCLPPL